MTKPITTIDDQINLDANTDGLSHAKGTVNSVIVANGAKAAANDASVYARTINRFMRAALSHAFCVSVFMAMRSAALTSVW